MRRTARPQWREGELRPDGGSAEEMQLGSGNLREEPGAGFFSFSKGNLRRSGDGAAQRTGSKPWVRKHPRSIANCFPQFWQNEPN